MDGDVRVIHVDDDADFLEVASQLLEAADERLVVETTTSLEAAMARLEEEEYDCVVSDYDMPDMNGISFLNQVREKYPDLPFILFTGQGSESVASEAISAGVTDYLQKETNTEVYTLLANRIENVVKANEAATDASQQRHRLKQILKTVPSCVVQLDRDGNFVFANRRAEEVLGLEQGDLVERTYNDPRWKIRDTDGSEIPDEDLPFQQVIASGEPVYDCVHKIQWPDGTERTLSVSGAPVFDGDTIDSVVFSLTDISHRLQREDQLARLHEASRALYDADSVESVAEITSQAAAQILDFELNSVHIYQEEADGLVPVAASDMTQAVADKLVTFDRGIAWEAYRNGEVRSYRDVRQAEEVYDPDTNIRSGLYFPLGHHGIIIVGSREVDDFGESDLSLGQLLAANATTALDRIERETLLRARSDSLAQQNRQLDEFASVVAHDLRNPLQTADGHIELARRTSDLSHLDDASQTLDRMETLITDLLTFARQGERVSEPESVRLDEIIEDAWETVPASTASISIETDQRVLADPTRLEQLFANLLGNSVEHGGDGVAVTVGSLEDGFYVADNGPGIPEEHRNEIFESGYSTSGAGTGFGLAIVRQITEAHDWDITVTESHSGGASFEITGVEFAE